MALPPSEAGAVKVIVDVAFPAVAVPMVGAPGTVAGITVLDADEDELTPIAFVAVTVNV